MSHFGRTGPPDIKDTYSLLVLNISFRTSADDLYPLFEKYGKVVDVFIPRDRRTGDSRGFAFVRYKYADEAHKAVEKLDVCNCTCVWRRLEVGCLYTCLNLSGRVVDGREIMVQFAKYGPNAERMFCFTTYDFSVVTVFDGFGFQSEREDSRTCIKVKRPVKKQESSTKVEIGYSLIYTEELVGPGIRMNTRTGIPREEVAAEVGAGMTGIDLEEGKEIIVIEAGAAVEALIIIKTVEEVDMMTRNAAGVDLMEVPPLLVVAQVLGGASLHAGHLHLGVEVLMDEIAKNNHLRQKGFLLVVDQLILEAPYNALMLMNKRAVFYVMIFSSYLLIVLCLAATVLER
ncbi:serine/arginine-rich splicing factor-like protein, putative [Actinidia rufa]|uniref:Serine/arginine-rich splicing factor-like protein, putative n=1 Tax=Actinidia rufa TaxID=165716 RepID=A0A7J0GGW5_9ERIC|nr:serine/arginine-rich splicing factor-like protein, putative [Actinidia rufa]